MELDPEHFTEAVEALRKRVPVTDEEYDKLDFRARRQAFRVANEANADMVAEVWRGIEKAVAEGITFEEWKDTFTQDPLATWTASRLETIFQTNVQKAYSDGRWAQQTDPDVLEFYPYWRFDGVEDSGQSPICRARNGTVLPATDPWWRSNNPPLHFRCRSTIVAIDEEEARERGIGKKFDKEPPIKGGFGHAPDDDGWTPNPDEYPPEIGAILREALSR